MTRPCPLPRIARLCAALTGGADKGATEKHGLARHRVETGAGGETREGPA